MKKEQQLLRWHKTLWNPNLKQICQCFQVRATSLQELVYKNGQAGITKASVTIIFDNTDEDNCPVGYEKCKEISVTRQVVVGGKNKYWINGKIVLNKKVTDLFCSVQMNVNNPNFLIMQGRITKVLNMKPMEVWYFDQNKWQQLHIMSMYRFTDIVNDWRSSGNEPLWIETRANHQNYREKRLEIEGNGLGNENTHPMRSNEPTNVIFIYIYRFSMKK